MAVRKLVTGAFVLLFLGGCTIQQQPRSPAIPGVRAWEFDDLSRFTKWTEVLNRIETDAGVPSHMIAKTQTLRPLPLPLRAQAVNNMVNAFSYIEDQVNWGRGDYWGTPGEFFIRGGGDCEDFAITKYVILRDLGVPEENMRITVVYDRYLRDMHALLAVELEDEILFLDNQMEVTGAEALTERYRPVFGLGKQGWWLYSQV